MILELPSPSVGIRMRELCVFNEMLTKMESPRTCFDAVTGGDHKVYLSQQVDEKSPKETG